VIHESKTRTVNPVEIVDERAVRLVPTTRIDLATVEQCRAEAARVYRQMRAGMLDPADGAKLIWAITQIAKLIEISVLEHRVRALEAEPKQIGGERGPTN